MVLWFEHEAGLRSSGTNLLFWLGLVGYGSIKIRSLILIDKDKVCACMEYYS